MVIVCYSRKKEAALIPNRGEAVKNNLIDKGCLYDVILF